MQFTTALLSAVLSATALAAPAPARSMVARDLQWTIESLSRTCVDGDTLCTWKFGINAQTGTVTPCEFTIPGNPASQTGLVTPAACGEFKVTTGWSGQFGEGQGFTTLAVVQEATRLIVYPAYTDNEIANGAVVSPDKSYTPAGLP